MDKVSSILLIDDNEHTNFYHARLIRKLSLAEKVVALENGEEALAYIESLGASVFNQPYLVLLDINMPVMNGWEFMEEWRKIPKPQMNNWRIFMVTTSLNPDDKARVDDIPEIRNLINKPVSSDTLKDIMTTAFEAGEQ